MSVLLIDREAAGVDASVSAGSAADGELLARMHAGDERALAELYDRYVALVHGVVVRTLGDREDAEEVVGETFWQAWRQAGRFDATRAAVSTWLSVIARSRALDSLRGQRRLLHTRTRSLSDAEANELEDADAPSPLDHVAAQERRVRVGAAMEALPAAQRRAVEFAYFEGLSQSEIASATGEPLGTVKTRIRLAALKLKEALVALREDVAPSDAGSRPALPLA